MSSCNDFSLFKLTSAEIYTSHFNSKYHKVACDQFTVNKCDIFM